MKQFSNLLRWFRQGFTPRQGKKGSSLALVMIIGAVLVIWVMAIMPMMVATGNASYGVQDAQEDYLNSRSAIEFCKSELEHIVVDKLPYTFALLNGDGSNGAAAGEYVAVPKKNGAETNSVYMDCIVEDAVYDTRDVPENSAAGNQVAAICAVTLNTDGDYDIHITTYHNGEKGLTFYALFTPSGALKIYPEAYNQSQALPLSDFVLVDGKLGSVDVWDSGIRNVWTVANGYHSDLEFTETLKPFQVAPEADYASSGEYPAVFKKTALAAESGQSIGARIEESPLTSEQNWIMPTGLVDAADTAGEIWYESGAVYMYVNDQNENVDITNACTIYFNGDNCSADELTATGTYAVTVDYSGTGEYHAESYNVLPGNGLQAGTLEKGDKDTTACDCTISLDAVSGGLFRIGNLDPYAEYGYYTAASGVENMKWVSGASTIDRLDVKETYYFYCYHHAAFDATTGAYHPASCVKFLGTVIAPTLESSLTDGEEYLVLGEYDSDYYAMTYHHNSGTLSSILYADDESMMGGLLVLSPNFTQAENLKIMNWTMINKKDGDQATDQWYFTQGEVDANDTYTAETYLQMTGERAENEESWIYTLGVGDSNQNGNFTISFSNSTNQTAANASRTFTGSTAYLSITDSAATCNTSSSTISFFKAPAEAVDASQIDTPALDAIVRDYPVPYGTTGLFDMVQSGSGLDLNALYASGCPVWNETKLDAGAYTLVGRVGNAYTKLGTLTVEKADLGQLTVSGIAQDDIKDEQKVTVTGSGWDNVYGGTRYFGYKNADDAEAEFSWVTTSEDSYTFCLAYDDYIFTVAQSGTTNYGFVTSADSEKYTIQAKSIGEILPSDFLYTVNEETGKATWYQLPEHVLPGKVTLVYGSSTGTGVDDIAWSFTYQKGVTVFYGVNIAGSDYTTPEGATEPENVFRIVPPQPITSNDGHMSSMLRGSSLYFMGEDASINTYGNDIYLTTDLLVLNNPIIGGGSVKVIAYTTGATDTLVYFRNKMADSSGNIVFKANSYYKVPSGTDLNSLNYASAELLWVSEKTVKKDFRDEKYPEINLDIAYADKGQLAAIVSGETIGWTQRGELSGSDSRGTTNAAYAVCAYVSKVSGPVSRSANRILIAAKETGSNTLTVPANLTFTTRYFSIDTDNLRQGAKNVQFVLKNLGQNDNFLLSVLSNARGLANYSSKTMQMDYERTTKILLYDDTLKEEVKAQICRYDDGTNLFGDLPQLDLLVPYSIDEIEQLLKSDHVIGSTVDGLSGAAVQTVDRYIMITDDLDLDGVNDTDGILDAASYNQVTLKMYANYIYIDGSVNKISLASSKGKNSFLINSQEYGYTAEEYLNLFQLYSGETYSGTLIYFAEPVDIVYQDGKDPVTVKPGFYHFLASKDGTDIAVLAVDGKTGYEVEEEELKDYSVYIKEDGRASNAYADTGFYTNAGEGLGGFSGGAVG